MADNCTHHINYIVQLVDWMLSNDVTKSDKYEAKLNKLFYCINKMEYNISVGRISKTDFHNRIMDGLAAMDYTYGQVTSCLQWAAEDYNKLRKPATVEGLV